jgi:hypothetical protein
MSKAILILTCRNNLTQTVFLDIRDLAQKVVSEDLNKKYVCLPLSSTELNFFN